MKNIRLCIVTILLLTILPLKAASKVADVVYVNGKIYTVNEAQPWAEAVAIKDGKFIAVGSDLRDVKPLKGDSTKVIDLEGKFTMPGLIDAHVHPLGVANSWANLRIQNPTDKDAMLSEIRKYAEEKPDLPMIRGEAWNLGVFENNSPRKELLDAIDSNRPIYISSQTGHSAWCNSKALELAGITRDTPNGGPFVFDIDPQTGEPSGTVREFAMGAVERSLPLTNVEAYVPALKQVLEQFTSFGFTTLKCAEGAQAWIVGAGTLDKQGGLNVRLFPCWEWRSHYSPHTDKEQDQLLDNWDTYVTDKVYPRYAKMFYDGGPDSYTAVLFEDYLGRPGYKGNPNNPKEAYLEKIMELNKNGIGVMIHVIGDRGAAEVVDIFAEVRKKNGDNGTPLHLSHAWMMYPEDMKRLAKLKDVCIDFSPVLAYPAPEIAGSFVSPIGEERYQKFYNVEAAFDAGLAVGLGSDWASSLIPDPDGFHQMQSWMTRKEPGDPDSKTLNPDQGITLKQAIRGYTLGGAECLGFGWDKKLGSIEEGKLADFIVVDRNLFETPAGDLFKAKVQKTILGGKVVFDRREEIEDLEVITIDITNEALQNAVDAAELDLLVADEIAGTTKRCCGFTPAEAIKPPAKVQRTFDKLKNNGYTIARPPKEIYWKNTDSNYWIQWTLKDDVAVLWAYDPELKKAVEVLQVKDNHDKVK